MDTRDKIIELIKSPKQIPKEDVLKWMSSEDLSVRAALYMLTDKAWSYIKPQLNMQEQCSFMRRYLIECLEKNLENKEDELIHTGFEAAWEIANWMKHLRKIDRASTVLADIAADLEKLYRKSNDKTRNRITTGALEHIFEDAELVPLFDKWRRDPELRSGYADALEWGKAHRK